MCRVNMVGHTMALGRKCSWILEGGRWVYLSRFACGGKRNKDV